MIPIQQETIRKILNAIQHTKIILPALQRKFVWKRRKITDLFDSLLQGFPINTLMFWEVNDISKQKMEFYKFIDENYQEGVSTNCIYPHVNYNENMTIVIDGQQRLTSLLIGLHGSYTTTKGKNKMYLYLNLDAPLNNNVSEDYIDSTDSYYNFEFIAENKVDSLAKKGEHWIRISEAYSDGFNPATYLIKHELSDNTFACDTLQKLSSLLNNGILNVYKISDEDSLQKVLNIFVRTNSGGEILTKGNLLLSIITTNWAYSNGVNAREYVTGIVNDVNSLGYIVDENWVLSCILYILNKNIKLSVYNFDKNTSEQIYNNRDRISRSIKSTCKLLRLYGIFDKGLTTKLALLPIVYHFYNFDFEPKGYTQGGKILLKTGIYADMRKWLFRSIVTGFFADNTNDKLTKIQNIQAENIERGKDYFPTNDIISHYEMDLDSNVNDELIDEKIKTVKKNAFPMLNIIYSTTDDQRYLYNDMLYHIDHIHAKTSFEKNSDDNRYDTIPNLQLLTAEENLSKLYMTAKEWWNKKNEIEKEKYILPREIDLDITAFDNFYDKRRKMLCEILAKKLDAKKSKYYKDDNEEDNSCN